MDNKFSKLKGLYLYIILLIVWCAGPLFWLIYLSFSQGTLVSEFIFVNYSKLFTDRSFLQIILNSLIVAVVSTSLSLSMATCCAYALTRRGVRFGKTILFLFLAISMFPSIATLSPLYMAFRSLGLRDTLLALIIPYTVFSLPIAVWMLSGYFKQLPKELEESARIEGCSEFMIFFDILLPLVGPGLATTAILVFVFCWNEFIFAVAFTATKVSRTIPADISLFPASSGFIIGQLAAASVVAAIPLIIIILFFQKKIVSGLTSGAVKE